MAERSIDIFFHTARGMSYTVQSLHRAGKTAADGPKYMASLQHTFVSGLYGIGTSVRILSEIAKDTVGLQGVQLPICFVQLIVHILQYIHSFTSCAVHRAKCAATVLYHEIIYIKPTVQRLSGDKKNSLE